GRSRPAVLRSHRLDRVQLAGVRVTGRLKPAGTGTGHFLGRVNRLREGLHRGLAPGQRGGRLLPPLIGAEVTPLDLAQPAGELLQVLLALLQLSEGVLPGLALLAELVQESGAALGE